MTFPSNFTVALLTIKTRTIVIVVDYGTGSSI